MRPCAALCALVLLAAGCAGGDEDAPRPPASAPVARDAVLPSAAEQAWVGELSGWMLGMQNAALQRNADYLADCTASLRSTVAPPPSPRLRPLRKSAGRACRDVERALALEPARAAEADRLHARAQRTFDGIVERILVSSQLTLDQALPVRGGPDVRASRVEPRVGRIATRVAGRRVAVRCWSQADWRRINRELAVYLGVTRRIAGYAAVGGDRVELAPEGCDPLVRVLYGGAWPDDGGDDVALAAAAVLLAHEVGHSRGLSNEARTECWGVQHVADVASLLRAPGAQARQLAETYWEEIYLSTVQDDEVYGSEECRNGGDLDARPNTDLWP